MTTDDEEDRKPAMKRFSTGFMTGPLKEQPGLRPTQPGEHAPNMAIELGPRMTDLVRRTPLDPEAEDQIETVIADPSMAEMRKPLVAVALLNCIERRTAEFEAGLAELKTLKEAIEKAAKGV